MVNEKNAAKQGFDIPRLEKIALRIENDIQDQQYDGARIIIARRGDIVFDLTAGYARREGSMSMPEDAIFSVMSISKVMTAIAVLQCVERGSLSLLDPVSKYIPGFSKKGKDNISIFHLLSHTSGLPAGPIPIPFKELENLSTAAAAVCNIPLDSTPGEEVKYSTMMGYTMLGEIVRIVDEKQRPFRKILEEDLFQPLGMTDTFLGMRPGIESRRVPIVVRAKQAPELNADFLTGRDQAASEATEMPSGGATFSTAQDIFRFGEALRRQGSLDGKTILSPATVRLMVANHTGHKPNSMMAASRAAMGMPAWPAFLGLGVFLRGEGIFPSHIPTLASPGAFGGWGLGTVGFWVDPEYEITFVALTSGVMERLHNLLRFQYLGNMAISSLTRPSSTNA